MHATSIAGTATIALLYAPALGAVPSPSAAAGAGLLALQEGPDLPAATVSGMLAQRAYEANLSVLRRTDEMAGAALQMLG